MATTRWNIRATNPSKAKPAPKEAPAKKGMQAKMKMAPSTKKSILKAKGAKSAQKKAVKPNKAIHFAVGTKAAKTKEEEIAEAQIRKEKNAMRREKRTMERQERRLEAAMANAPKVAIIEGNNPLISKPNKNFFLCSSNTKQIQEFLAHYKVFMTEEMKAAQRGLMLKGKKVKATEWREAFLPFFLEVAGRDIPAAAAKKEEPANMEVETAIKEKEDTTKTAVEVDEKTSDDQKDQKIAAVLDNKEETANKEDNSDMEVDKNKDLVALATAAAAASSSTMTEDDKMMAGDKDDKKKEVDKMEVEEDAETDQEDASCDENKDA